MLIKNLIARIATPNNKTNSYPPHKRTVTAIEKSSKAELNYLPTQKLWNTRSTTVSLTLSPVSSKMQEIASSRETVTAS